MITIHISPVIKEQESIRQIIGYYRGIPTFEDNSIIHIKKKKEFNQDGLFLTLKSMGYVIKIIK